jgi:orotidine-5'-phosphate decarboxylase
MLMIDKLIEKIKENKNPICIALDTNIDVIPENILNDEINEKWYTPKAYTTAMLKFNKIIIDSIFNLVPAISINIAYYEKYGIPGIRTFIDTINYAKEKDLIVIGDIKRAEYIESYLGKISINKTKQSSYHSDFITTNPYLGINALKPFVEDCLNYEKGMFIILKTGSNDFKDLIIEDPDNPGDRNPLYYKFANQIDELGTPLIGENNFSSIGAVIQPTHSSQLTQLRSLHPTMFFLISENKSEEESFTKFIPAFRRDDKIGALIVTSKNILTAYKNPTYSGLGIERSIIEETKLVIKSIQSYLSPEE